jgi:hypothetical protein
VVFVRKINEKPHLRFCPKQRIWRSFAVLRRTSLATLAQRLRQAQDDNLFGCGTEIFTTSPDGSVDDNAAGCAGPA